MTPLEERNLVWNLLELLIEKHELENNSEFLDPNDEDEVIFGNYIKGHPMCFEESFSGFIAELTRKLPSDYCIAISSIIGTGDAVIGITKTY